MKKQLQLYSKRSQLPQSLRDYLWESISQKLINAISARRLELTENGIPAITEDDTLQVITNFHDGLIDESYYENCDTEMMTQCIGLLEDHLPNEIAYLRNVELKGITPKLIDRQLAAKTLLRHLMAYDEAKIKYLNSNFLYWARGVITLYAPDAKACLDKIDQRLTTDVDYVIKFK